MRKIDLLTALLNIITNNTKWMNTDIISFAAYFRIHEFFLEHDFVQIRNSIVIRNPNNIHLDCDEGLFLEMIFGTAPKLGKKVIMFSKDRNIHKWTYTTFPNTLNEIEERLRDSDVDCVRCYIK